MNLYFFWVSLAIVSVLARGQTIIETINSEPNLSKLTDYLTQYPDFSTWLAMEKITLLAPTNKALEELQGSTTGVPRNLSKTDLAYHILDGSYSQFGHGRVQYILTLLPKSGSSNVSGGQFVVAQGSSLSNTTTFWSGLQRASYTTGSTFSCSNGAVYMIDRLLTLPHNFSYSYEKSPMIGASPFVEAVLPRQNSEETTSIDQISNVTIFLPINYAFKEIGNIVNNWTLKDLDRVMSYHIIDEVLLAGAEGPPVGKYSTLEGSDMTISMHDGHLFVNNAKIVGLNNWFFEGGMIYTIYGVLNPDNTTLTPTVTDSGIAFANASFTTDLSFPSQPLTSGTGSDTNEKSNASGLSTGAKAAIGVGVAAAVVIGAIAGGWIFYGRKTRKQTAAEKHFPLVDLNASQKNLTGDEQNAFGHQNQALG